jgi:uncharacterized protein (DUF433 family)
LVREVTTASASLSRARRRRLAVAVKIEEGVNVTITERIEIDTKIMLGKPIIRGTRITVELVLRKLAEGASEEDLTDAYPQLTREDIKAAIRHAADTNTNEETIMNSPRRTKRRA